VQEKTSQSWPPSIYKPLKEIEPLALSLGKFRGHWTRSREPPDGRPSASSALELATCPPLNLARQTLTVTYGPPDATKWAPDASGTHWSRAHRGLQTLDLTGRVAPDASGTHWTHVQRLHTGLTPPDTPRASGALSQQHLKKPGSTGRANSKYPTSGAVRSVLNPNRAKH